MLIACLPLFVRRSLSCMFWRCCQLENFGARDGARRQEAMRSRAVIITFLPPQGTATLRSKPDTSARDASRDERCPAAAAGQFERRRRLIQLSASNAETAQFPETPADFLRGPAGSDALNGNTEVEHVTPGTLCKGNKSSLSRETR